MKRTLKIWMLALVLSGMFALFPTLGAEHEHSYEVWASQEPTCTEKGAVVFKCGSCGETYTEEKAALGHDFKNYWDIDFEPTCGKQGQRSRHCKRCDAVTDVIAINALSHTFEVSVVEPTCTSSGYDLYVCKVCGLETKNNIQNALGHRPSLWIIDREATCETDGLRHTECTVCGITLEKAPISATKHNYKTVTVEPTCTEKGYSLHTCTVCGYSYKNKETKALGHSFSETGQIIESPTCTSKGSQMVFCKICGVTQSQSIAALGHDYSDSWTIDKAATCSAAGQKSHHCKRCGARRNVTSIEKLEHTVVTDKAVAATCTEKGKTQGSHCSVCNTTIVRQTSIAALGHDYSIIEKISDPTCTEAGVNRLTCSRCAEQKNQSVAKLGHNYTSYMIVDKAPTCTAKGEQSRHCLRCSARTQVTSMDRKAHTEVVDKAVAATCTKSGKTKGSHCAVCGKVLTAQTKISATGHKASKTVTKATAKKNGKIVVKCKTCKAALSTTTVYKIKTASLSKTSYTYDAKTHKPTVTIQDSKGKTLKKSTDYTIKYASGRKKIGSYVVTVTFKGNYSGTKKLKFTVVPKAPTGLNYSSTAKSITLSWKKVSSASGYRVYEYNAKTRKYTLIGRTKHLYLKMKKLGGAEKHSYAVRAYKTVGSKNFYSGFSSLKKTATKPAVPKVKISSSSGRVVLSWNNVGSVEYEIYRAAKKNGKYVCIGTTKKRKFVSSSLPRGKTYAFKVKAFVKNSTTTLSSVSSDIKTVTVK